MLEEFDLQRVADVAERLDALAREPATAPAAPERHAATVPTRPSDSYRQLTSDLEALHRILLGDRAPR